MATTKQYEVILTDDERARLAACTRKGSAAAREVRRARILLLAAEGRTDAAVAEAVGGCGGTVACVRRRCAEAGVEAAVADRPRPGATPLRDGKGEGPGLSRPARGSRDLDHAGAGRAAGGPGRHGPQLG